MKCLMNTLFCLLVMVSNFPNQSFAQSIRLTKHFDIKDSTQVHLMRMKDGDVFKGRVLDMETDSLSFVSQRNVVLKVHHDEIKEIRVVGKDPISKRPKRNVGWEKRVLKNLYTGEQKKAEPVYPQGMFLHATAFKPISKGTRLYQNIDFYYSSFEYGLDNGFSVAIQGVLPIVTNLSLKYNYSFSEIVHVGGNFNLINVFNLDMFFGGGDNGGLLAYSYGVVTIGKPNIYLNATAGVVFPTGQKSNLLEERRGVFTLGVGGRENRFAYKGMLALYKGMEYYYDPITNTSGSNLVWAITPAFSLGWRGNRTYIDVGAAFLVNEEFVFPYLSLKRKIVL